MAIKGAGKARPSKRIAAILIAMAAFCTDGPLQAEMRTYLLPQETARLRPGQNVEIAEANCAACHSVDYINMQPRGKGKAFWTAEVNKMIKVFGAPIEQEDAAKIIGYLAASY
jgi:sulfite dehydrogenase (cytochrome) subunit B